MEFKSNRPIYLQIRDYCHTRILGGVWQPGSRMPSVRELAVELSVNVNTVLKAYEVLETEGVIYTRRGLGYFVADDGVDRISHTRRQEFFDETLPGVFDAMADLGIGIDDIIGQYVAYSDKKH